MSLDLWLFLDESLKTESKEWRQWHFKNLTYVFSKSLFRKLEFTFSHSQQRCSIGAFSSVQSLSCVRTLHDAMDCSMPGFPLPHHLPTSCPTLPKFMSVALVMPSSQLILWHPLLLPSIFPSIRVFSSELAVRIRWPKYWSFSFSVSPSNEYSKWCLCFLIHCLGLS